MENRAAESARERSSPCCRYEHDSRAGSFGFPTEPGRQGFIVSGGHLSGRTVSGCWRRLCARARGRRGKTAPHDKRRAPLRPRARAQRMIVPGCGSGDQSAPARAGAEVLAPRANAFLARDDGRNVQLVSGIFCPASGVVRGWPPEFRGSGSALACWRRIRSGKAGWTGTSRPRSWRYSGTASRRDRSISQDSLYCLNPGKRDSEGFAGGSNDHDFQIGAANSGPVPDSIDHPQALLQTNLKRVLVISVRQEWLKRLPCRNGLAPGLLRKRHQTLQFLVP